MIRKDVRWWDTTWFLLLAGLAMLLLLVALVQIWLKLRAKRREEQARAEQSAQALMQSSNLREKLISLVIHDLRSPLRFLSLLASDLLDNQSNYSPEEIRERIYWIKKGTQDIYNFSEDFLLWVTSQRDNFNISRRQIQLRPLLQEIYDFFQEQVQQKGNSLSYSAEESLTTWSDPHILITIIRNLVDNANKYTDGGKIILSAYEKDAQLCISVSDTGKGMSPKQTAYFMQQVSLDHVYSGSQLGHKFVYDLTRRLNGNVSIDSREGKGTTVWLKFPIEKESRTQ
ncbi:MAG: HAMP domain-containing histidine kinase [Chitinophagaceae bacterium]|nr:HAMP domain-containing histidine kinase [Chitinophagaceae bacterium]